MLGKDHGMSRLLVVLTIAVPATLGLAALLWLRAGTADRRDGVPTVARVEQLGEGSCTFGATHEHCYRLMLEVMPRAAPAFKADLDVLVPDRFASRVQPGEFVWVVRKSESSSEIALALEAFAEPPPIPPAVHPQRR
jgi:hypothetical protein